MNPYEPFERENEKPLDVLPVDGGFSSIFRTICCIGDSFSSGELQTEEKVGGTCYHDIYEHSWGQYLARMTGAKAYNFSRAGMSAKEYCESFADSRGLWDPAYASQAYILALGINDLLNLKHPVGDISDIDLSDWRNNKQTFAGFFGQIVQRMKEIQPNAKFFFMTMPRYARDTEEIAELRRQHSDILYQMAELFSNAYVLDFHQYAPIFDDRFRELYFLNSHMNPCGYALIGKMVSSYLDYIIRHNMEDFKSIGFVGHIM